jgi:hypothetical protein
MNETFLSFIWKYRLYTTDLRTTSGELVTVLSPGEQNSNSGPDFFNARLRIGETVWAGNVEIHLRSSDWYRHSHQSDLAYASVILHVVYEADCDIMLQDQRTVATVALKGQMHEIIQSRYSDLVSSVDPIPCARSLPGVSPVIWKSWADRMLVERLEQKSELIRDALHHSKGDWEHAFYQVLAGGFGFRINSLPFAMLARVLPLRLLQKHHDDTMLCEALVFGQAGFLNDPPADVFQRELQEHYRFLSAKYQLLPLEKHIWKFLRMRPVNFPTIRLSQFNSLVTAHPALFNSFMSAGSVSDYFRLMDVKTSPYWNEHYVFGKKALFRVKHLGKESAVVLLVNSVAPFLFLYGKWTGEEQRCEQAFRLLQELPAEHNRILTEWNRAGVNFSNGFETQAALELYRNYCVRKNCLNCSIGTHLLKSAPVNG